MEGYERRSLFLKVTREEAEVSIVASVKYLINHFFEMYGTEVRESDVQHHYVYLIIYVPLCC